VQSSYRRWTKRWIDFLVLIGLAPLLFVLLVGLGGLVRWRMGTPVFFKQVRIGYRDRPFTLVKFRTMVDSRDSDGKLLHEDQRLTSFGMFLRRSSLDELPTLWNVLRGDMTLVGPRPLLVEYLPLYDPVQRRRHEVMPGVTGWAQVNGRNAISWEQKFAHDVWYVDNISFSLDAKIFWLTILKVLSWADITPPGMKSMPAFRGPSDDNQ
jgi:lipopolysaccharide/colanic/teichoic acid biosynthesis glycosyltransferase